MRTFDIETHLKFVLNDFKGRVVDQEMIDSLCNRLSDESSNEFCHIVWCTEDIEEIRPDWSKEKVDAVAQLVGEQLQDRSTEEGWEILEILLDWNGENYDKEEE